MQASQSQLIQNLKQFLIKSTELTSENIKTALPINQLEDMQIIGELWDFGGGLLRVSYCRSPQLGITNQLINQSNPGHTVYRYRHQTEHYQIQQAQYWCLSLEQVSNVTSNQPNQTKLINHYDFISGCTLLQN
ncbi:hypothetical protein ABPG72_020154 [Tetrahymena utriculariae]